MSKNNKNPKKKGNKMAATQTPEENKPFVNPTTQPQPDAETAAGTTQAKIKAKIKEKIDEKIESDFELETVADLTPSGLNRLAEKAATLPKDEPKLSDKGAEAFVTDVRDALEQMRVAERMFRRFVKRDGGFRKGLTETQQTECRTLMKRMGKTQLTWDQSILPQ